jgi:hypothetical protein
MSTPIQEEQTAKYALGTIIEVEGHALKAENGRFKITLQIPQPAGNAYFQWKRLGRNDKVLGESTNNHRGRRFTWLERHAKIVGRVVD